METTASMPDPDIKQQTEEASVPLPPPHPDSQSQVIPDPLVQAVSQNFILPELQQLQLQIQPIIEHWANAISPCWPHLTIMGFIGFIISLLLGIQKIVLAFETDSSSPKLFEHVITEIVDVYLNTSFTDT
jgi:hypothetical protein